MNSLQNVKVNFHSQFHTEKYFVHTLEDINFNENLHKIQVEITIKKLQNHNIQQCVVCKDNLISFLRKQKTNIFAIQFNVFDFYLVRMLLEDNQIADTFRQLHLKELTIKCVRIELNLLKQIFDLAIHTFSSIDTISIEIAFSKFDKEQISLLSAIRYLSNLKSFSLKLKQIDWPLSQLIELFEKDIGSILLNISKIQISLNKINFSKEKSDIFKVFQLNKLDNLQEFSLSLDYITGNILFPSDFLKNALNLKSFCMQISYGQFIHEIIQTLKNVSCIDQLQQFSLKLLECEIPAKLAVDLAYSLKSLKNLESLDLKFVPQKITMKTQILKPLFSEYEQIMSNLVLQNRNLQNLCLNLESESTKTMLDAVGFYENIQFTDFFNNKSYPNLKEIKYIDCSYSGVNRYNATSLIDYNMFQHQKNQNLLEFLYRNKQIILLQISETLVNSQYIKEFSNCVCKMKNLKTLEIEFREISSDAIFSANDYQNLFSQMNSLEFVKLKVTDLRKYQNLFANKNIKQLTLKQYSQFIKLENFILQFKVQKLINSQKAIIGKLDKDQNYRSEEFTKIIVLEEGGNDYFQLLDCIVIDNSNRIQYFNDKKHAFYNFILFYKFLYHQIQYSPQQTLYDLYEQ
ncbi:hypothetical protein TTHERM_00171700 (macronuclear) [Tetrahymena thermophila SB210]|uniref:Uncharacterized protein n=1 Tax=Tetrahymena thermophila (strain SB210) TaxID=312017 RepID=Q22TF5_TETTS|nr:hypothetical protein TTHERM_00171700 [Tetrahymena thermophila SB210]EAR88483.1 hypothetical protein TTHERM_00171700 [Tetrahymena thermophila SB210]|eukprot:XP_001008728.1 hypothetical protein TTHERM_00171700 [Tetrahymena thermophila SB210]